MNIVLTVIWFITYTVGAVWYELYIVHMFQQNSYKPREYMEWMRVHSNVGRLLGKCLYGMISLPLVLIGGRGCVIAACVMNIMTMIVNKPHAAKKPLVYTKRVKRMLITTALIYLIGVLLALFLPIGEYRIALTELATTTIEDITYRLQICAGILTGLFIIQPFLILLVNLINRPIEKGIDQHYINDAVRILKEMPDLKIIGVTGSYGKTSVKYFLIQRSL